MAATNTVSAQTFQSLFSFDGVNGDNVYGGLAQGPNGNFYGTTSAGGANSSGTVYEITPSGKLTTLYAFCSQTGCPDGTAPVSGLTLATNGDLYGTTSEGGANGYGTVFSITPSGTLTTLHSFAGTDGAKPYGGLVQASNGKLYGTTFSGGSNGQGEVFAMTLTGALTVLYNFCPQILCPDGQGPEATLLQGKNGNLYGTTSFAGSNGFGTVFEVTPSGTFTSLYNFCSQPGCADGEYSFGRLVQASNGTLYGVTNSGGLNNAGTIFEITQSGSLTTLYSFCPQSGCTDGSYPEGGLVLATDGSLEGTTAAGGSTNAGTIFKINAAGNLTAA